VAGEGPVFVLIPWIANPFRGDRFEEAWLPVAEAAIDYGASYWSLVRSDEGGLEFIQTAVFPSKLDFERYWYSEEVAEARTKISGLFQVPVLPTFHKVVGTGVAGATAPSSAPT
jgi:hypothetical protein